LRDVPRSAFHVVISIVVNSVPGRLPGATMLCVLLHSKSAVDQA
jgi:hypothetical protein